MNPRDAADWWKDPEERVQMCWACKDVKMRKSETHENEWVCPKCGSKIGFRDPQ